MTAEEHAALLEKVDQERAGDQMRLRVRRREVGEGWQNCIKDESLFPPEQPTADRSGILKRVDATVVLYVRDDEDAEERLSSMLDVEGWAFRVVR